MKFLSLLLPVTQEAIEAFPKIKDTSGKVFEARSHPQEDYLLTSETPPIFVVGDGVTLNFERMMKEGRDYPNPSPAGKVAQIFCEAVIKSASDKYLSFDQGNVLEVFKEANREVEKYNQEVGVSDICGNPTGFYSATGSFIVVKDNKAYWSSICDAYVAHFDKDMNQKFMSTGVCRPYAVINGGERMAEYLESGVFDLELGDTLFVLTDGFEKYVKNQDFLELFKIWDDTLEKRILAFGEEMNKQDPAHYGHERSIIAIKI